MLLAGIKLLLPEKINSILMNEYDKYPWFCWDCVRGLKKTGGLKELKFLKEKLQNKNLSKKEKIAIEKAINAIEKRILID